MKQFRRKPHSGRSRGEHSYEHWLGEGIAGQETLLDDLDPTLYLSDAPICSIITSTALNCDRRDRRPQAILVPDEGTVGWHIGYLAKRFDVAVWTGDDDELVTETAFRFKAKTFSGDLSEGADDGCDLVLFTAYTWPSEAECWQTIDEAADILSENGVAAFILPIELRDSEIVVRWSASAPTSLAGMTDPQDANSASPRSAELFWFNGFDPREPETIGGFIKRHKEYFGKNVRELILDRLAGPEFQLAGSNNGIAILVFTNEE